MMKLSWPKWLSNGKQPEKTHSGPFLLGSTMHSALESHYFGMDELIGHQPSIQLVSGQRLSDTFTWALSCGRGDITAFGALSDLVSRYLEHIKVTDAFVIAMVANGASRFELTYKLRHSSPLSHRDRADALRISREQTDTLMDLFQDLVQVQPRQERRK